MPALWVFYYFKVMENHELSRIRYIRVPQNLKVTEGSFKIDPEIRLPIQLKEGKKNLDEEDLTIEAIVAGMLTLIAYDELNKDIDYYKAFVKAVEPEIAQNLNTAAIAKQEAKDFDFAEELFLAVYHLEPQGASCINLATLYSYMSVNADEKGEDDKADEYLAKAKATLLDGLRRFGENEWILAELASFEGFLGNLEEAKDYAERYLKVASEGKRKEEIKSFLKEVNAHIESDTAFKEAYDYVMLDMPEKAISSIDRFIENNQKIWNGYFIKAWALRKAQRYEEAKECLLKCIALGESNTDIYNELSICELEGGNRELAKNYLNTAADLDETNLTALSNLAYLHLEDKEFDDARYYLEKARNIANDDEIIKNLIATYEKATGEKIGDKITEEVIDSKEDEEMEEIMEELEKGNTEEKHCNHGHDEGHCCHHHDGNEEHGHCHHHSEEGNDHCCHGEHEGDEGKHCCHHHDGEEEGHCCHHHDGNEEHRHCHHHHGEEGKGHCCHHHEEN